MRKIILAGFIAAVALVGCGGSSKPTASAQLGPATSATAAPTTTVAPTTTTTTVALTSAAKAGIWRVVVSKDIPEFANMDDGTIANFAQTVCDLARSSSTKAAFTAGFLQAGITSGNTYSGGQLGTLAGATLQGYCPDEATRLVG